jgi:hypothetical protein
MKINLDALFALLGAKEFDLFNAQREIAELRKRLSEAEEKLSASRPEGQ